MIVEYDKKIDPNCNDGSDLSENDINATITFNTFAIMNPEMVEIRDADDDFSSDLIPDQFKIENNALLQPCLCWTDADIDEALDEEDDEDDDTVLFAKKVLNSMLCFTNHMPPVLGEWKLSWIIQPLRFYVKSILENLEVLKLPFVQFQKFSFL